MQRRLHYFLLTFILLYTAIVRIYLINIPFHTTAEGVGSWYGIMARNYLRIPWSEHHGVPVQSIGHWPKTPLRFYSHHPPLMPLSIALSYKLFGQGDWQTRLPAVFCTIGSTVLLYLLLKQYSPPAALYASAIFASLPITLYYGGQPEFLNPQFVFLLLLTTGAFFRFNSRPTINSLLLLCGLFTLAAATDWPTFYLVPLATIHFLFTHQLKNWRLILCFVLFSIAVFALLYTQIVLVATHDWTWMLDQLRTRTIGTTPSQKVSFLTWLRQAWTYNHEHHTIPVLILSTVWLITTIANRKSQIANQPTFFLLLFALIHLLIARQGSYSHSWWWWPLTPFLALSSALALTEIIRLLPARAKIPTHILAILLLLLFSTINLKITLPHLLDPNLTSANQPYDGPTLARAVRFASPGPNTPVMLISGDVNPSLWYYADRPIKMHVWSIDEFNRRL
ncbi:MAG TPA: glycosyltransferase family 39 protein, partial [Tepidisphaeraceae bacterium]|nr:glycosyltransferase family 39 protein [Tepidisphaeraceae bacterium]